jgi:hypothetical protein
MRSMRHLPTPAVRWKSVKRLVKRLHWMLSGDAGCKYGGLKIRVSVVRFRPLATINFPIQPLVLAGRRAP